VTLTRRLETASPLSARDEVASQSRSSVVRERRSVSSSPTHSTPSRFFLRGHSLARARQASRTSPAWGTPKLPRAPLACPSPPGDLVAGLCVSMAQTGPNSASASSHRFPLTAAVMSERRPSRSRTLRPQTKFIDAVVQELQVKRDLVATEGSRLDGSRGVVEPAEVPRMATEIDDHCW